jgi:hypothetical protein
MLSCAPGLPSKSAATSSLDSVEMFTPSTAKKQSPASVNMHEHEREYACAYVYMRVCICACWCVLAHTGTHTYRGH